MIRTRRADQALRARHSPSTAVDLDVREGDVYGFLGANGSGKTTTVRMLLGLVLATCGTIEVLGQPMPRAGAGGAAAGRRAGRGPGGVRAPVRAGEPRAARRDRPRRRPRDPRPGGSTTPSSRSASAASASGRSGPTRWACGSGSGWPRRCCASPRLLVLDEPTNGLDPQGIREVRELLLELNAGRHDGLPVQPPARRGRAAVHPGRRARPRPAGAAGRARRCCSARPAGSSCAPRTPTRPARCSTGGSSVTTATAAGRPRGDPADAQRPARRRPACRVTELAAERRTLEDVVLEASRPEHGPGGPRDDRASSCASCSAAGAPGSRSLLLDALPTLVAVLLAVTDLGPRPGHGPGVPVGGAHRRRAVPAGRAGHRAAAVPADRGRGHRRRRDRRRGPGRAPCATCWSGRSAAPGCWSPSWSRDGVRGADGPGRRRDGVRRRDRCCSAARP